MNFKRVKPLPVLEASQILTPLIGQPIAPAELGLTERGAAWSLGNDTPIQAAILIGKGQAQVLALAGDNQPRPRLLSGAVDAQAIADALLLVLKEACGDEVYDRLLGASA